MGREIKINFLTAIVFEICWILWSNMAAWWPSWIFGFHSIGCIQVHFHVIPWVLKHGYRTQNQLPNCNSLWDMLKFMIQYGGMAAILNFRVLLYGIHGNFFSGVSTMSSESLCKKSALTPTFLPPRLYTENYYFYFFCLRGYPCLTQDFIRTQSLF